MSIISSHSLVKEAKKKIKSINFDVALKLHKRNKYIFVDLRDIRELKINGKILNARHAPRGMLEFWIDPQSPYFKDYFKNDNAFIFYCASGWRSALATKTVLDMGLIKVLNLENGFNEWKKLKGPIENV